MPSVIGTDPASGVNVAANYLKAFPSTKFGTRELVFAVVSVDDDLQTNYNAADSLFSQAVRAVQLQAEIYAIGEPVNNEGTSTFIAVLASDTLADNIESRSGALTLEDAIANALNTAVNVNLYNLVGGTVA